MTIYYGDLSRRMLPKSDTGQVWNLKKGAVRNVSPSITPAMLHQFAHCSCKQKNALSWKGRAYTDFLE